MFCSGQGSYPRQKEATVTLGTLIESLLGSDLPVGLRAYDGTVLGPQDSATTVVIRSPQALARMVQAPGEIGLARAYVAGEIDVEGDIFAALALRDNLPDLHLGPRQIADATRVLGRQALRRVPPPPEEARLRGRRHSKQRDREAISYHYDVSNDFYRLILGPSMTYSCAVWSDPGSTLEQAQTDKYDLIARKLDLRAGMRLLDVGCGWGGMVMRAADHYGADALGITVSTQQQEWGAKAIAERGLTGQAAVRLEDYRDIDAPPFDAISSIGMFEHVGLSQLRTYFDRLYQLVRPGGRVLNHGISQPGKRAPLVTGGWSAAIDALPSLRGNGFKRTSFIDRYVFPDGELHEVGAVVSAMQAAGFEVRHVESLREHYGLTLRAWVANLEANWDAAAEAVGLGRARVWRLYMAACALNFEAGRTSIHQVLAVRPDGGTSGVPLRPAF
jgi:cyclopropane-fatty-acyl-phospholipid synthase